MMLLRLGQIWGRYTFLKRACDELFQQERKEIEGKHSFPLGSFQKTITFAPVFGV
jgi:hypothetical protein